MESSYNKQLESELVVRFQDCDPYGHLNNAKYLDYFFNARADQTLQYYGWSPLKLSKEYKAHWVVTDHQISYLRPAMYGETVAVKTSLIFFDHHAITTECIMLNQERNELKAIVWTTLRNVSMETGRSTNHSPELMELLLKLIITEFPYSPLSFRDRLHELKEHYNLLGQKGKVSRE
jgi:acyl-CoA thioester hydrolase